MRLLRAGQSRRRGRLRFARRMRRLGARRQGGAAVSARAFGAVDARARRGRGRAAAARRAAELLGRPRSRDRTIIDRRHPQAGASVAGRMLMMPAGAARARAARRSPRRLRLGNGPAAILMLERDAIVIVGAMVAAELYGLRAPSRWRTSARLGGAGGRGQPHTRGRPKRRGDQRRRLDLGARGARARRAKAGTADRIAS